MDVVSSSRRLFSYTTTEEIMTIINAICSNVYNFIGAMLFMACTIAVFFTVVAVLAG